MRRLRRNVEWSLAVTLIVSGCEFFTVAPTPTASMSGTAKIKVKSAATGNLTEQPAVSTVADVTLKILRDGTEVTTAVAKKGDGSYSISEIDLGAGTEFKVNAEYQGGNYVGASSFTLSEGANTVNFELEFTFKDIDVIKG